MRAIVNFLVLLGEDMHIDVELIASEEANAVSTKLAPIATKANFSLFCKFRTMPRIVNLSADRPVVFPVGKLALSTAIVRPAVRAFAKLHIAIAAVYAHPVAFVPLVPQDRIELHLGDLRDLNLRRYSAMPLSTLVPTHKIAFCE